MITTAPSRVTGAPIAAPEGVVVPNEETTTTRSVMVGGLDRWEMRQGTWTAIDANAVAKARPASNRRTGWAGRMPIRTSPLPLRWHARQL